MSQTFEAAVEAACADRTIAGCAVAAVTADDSFSYSNAWGARALGAGEETGKPKPDDLPFELDTVIRMASCTKLVTSIAVLQCVERGLIGIDDDVSHLLPKLAEQQVVVKCTEDEEILEDRKEKITLRYLVTHSAGTQNGAFDTVLPHWRKRRNLNGPIWESATIEQRNACPLTFQPGSSWGYGTGHDWAGRIVELLTKQTLEEYWQANIAAPLGIKSLTFWPANNPALADKIAQTVKRDETTGKVVRDPSWPPYENKDCFGGGGGASNMPDYLKLLRSLLRNDGVLLKPETVDLMFTPQLTPASKKAFNDLSKTMVTDPNPPEADWGFGAQLTLGESEVSARSAGTLSWGGLPNLTWFIDRKKGICAIFGTMLLPMADKKVTELTRLFEREMYKRAGLS